MPDAATACEGDAWDPGLRSDIPQALLPQITLFAPSNGFVSYAQAKELADLTGINALDLYALRPERLMTHALLVRVTADLTVPDGPAYAELGINLRNMVKVLFEVHVKPHMPEVDVAYDNERTEAHRFITATLEQGFAIQPIEPDTPAASPSLWSRWFGQAKTTDRPKIAQVSDVDVVEQWKQQRVASGAPMQKACLESLIKTVGTIVGHRGRMLPDHSLVTDIAVNRAMNATGASLVNKMLDEYWHSAVDAEGYRVLPVQKKPVVMNVKGASASGKSTVRPQQRQLAGKLGIDWEDFALISPDYWRKYLLDYASLGEHYKYAAMLTGRELEIIDKKLDEFMAAKAADGALPHLLIDRFRFDSFIVNIDKAAGSKLLSRFGDRVYLFFLVTHPVQTVQRAWIRGKQTGRYKAVDDLLYHNVEAFTGMPDLFLSWVNSRDKQIHFEFLDNDVPQGTLPRTAAFGGNNALAVVDIKLLLNIDRYRKVNIDARQPGDVLNDKDMQASVNTAFVQRCVQHIDLIVFADKQLLEPYAVVCAAKLLWWDNAYIETHSSTDGLLDILTLLGYSTETPMSALTDLPDTLTTRIVQTMSEKRMLVGHLSDIGVELLQEARNCD